MPTVICGTCVRVFFCRWGPMEGALSELQAAADWKEAEATGRVVPSEVCACVPVEPRA